MSGPFWSDPRFSKELPWSSPIFERDDLKTCLEKAHCAKAFLQRLLDSTSSNEGRQYETVRRFMKQGYQALSDGEIKEFIPRFHQFRLLDWIAQEPGAQLHVVPICQVDIPGAYSKVHKYLKSFSNKLCDWPAVIRAAATEVKFSCVKSDLLVAAAKDKTNCAEEREKLLRSRALWNEADMHVVLGNFGTAIFHLNYLLKGRLDFPPTIQELERELSLPPDLNIWRQKDKEKPGNLRGPLLVALLISPIALFLPINLESRPISLQAGFEIWQALSSAKPVALKNAEQEIREFLIHQGKGRAADLIEEFPALVARLMKIVAKVSPHEASWFSEALKNDPSANSQRLRRRVRFLATRLPQQLQPPISTSIDLQGLQLHGKELSGHGIPSPVRKANGTLVSGASDNIPPAPLALGPRATPTPGLATPPSPCQILSPPPSPSSARFPARLIVLPPSAAGIPSSELQQSTAPVSLKTPPRLLHDSINEADPASAQPPNPAARSVTPSPLLAPLPLSLPITFPSPLSPQFSPSVVLPSQVQTGLKSPAPLGPANPNLPPVAPSPSSHKDRSPLTPATTAQEVAESNSISPSIAKAASGPFSQLDGERNILSEQPQQASTNTKQIFNKASKSVTEWLENNPGVDEPEGATEDAFKTRKSSRLAGRIALHNQDVADGRKIRKSDTLQSSDPRTIIQNFSSNIVSKAVKENSQKKRTGRPKQRAAKDEGDDVEMESDSDWKADGLGSGKALGVKGRKSARSLTPLPKAAVYTANETVNLEDFMETTHDDDPIDLSPATPYPKLRGTVQACIPIPSLNKILDSYDFFPEFHHLQDLEYFYNMYKVFCSQEPPILPGGKHSRIKVIDWRAYQSIPPGDILSMLRTHHIVIVNKPVEKTAFDEVGLRKVGYLDQTRTLHDLSIPIGADGNYNDRHRGGTLKDLLSLSQMGKAVNCLDCPLTASRGLPEKFESHSVAWERTERRQSHQHPHDYPFKTCNWGLAATAGCFHTWHVDAAGFVAKVGPVCGVKVWVLGRVKPGLDMASLTFFDEPFAIDKTNDQAVFPEMLALLPGMELIQGPGLHTVFTPEPSIVIGGHCYVTALLQQTVSVILHTFVSGKTITNNDHTRESFLLLSRMLSFFHQELLESGSVYDPDDEVKAHLPDLSTFDGVLDVLYICALFELGPVLFPDCYLRDRYMIVRARQCGRQLLHWLFGTFECIDVNGDSINGHQLFDDLVAQLAAGVYLLQDSAVRSEARYQGGEDSGESEVDEEDNTAPIGTEGAARLTEIDSIVKRCLEDRPRVLAQYKHNCDARAVTTFAYDGERYSVLRRLPGKGAPPVFRDGRTVYDIEAGIPGYLDFPRSVLLAGSGFEHPSKRKSSDVNKKSRRPGKRLKLQAD